MRHVDRHHTQTHAVTFWSPIGSGRWTGEGLSPPTSALTTHREQTEAAVRLLRRQGVAAFAAPIGAAPREGGPTAWDFNTTGPVFEGDR